MDFSVKQIPCSGLWSPVDSIPQTHSGRTNRAGVRKPDFARNDNQRHFFSKLLRDVELSQTKLPGADELGEAGFGNDETPGLAVQEAHPRELFELGRDGFPGGPNQVGQIFMG